MGTRIVPCGFTIYFSIRYRFDKQLFKRSCALARTPFLSIEISNMSWLTASSKIVPFCWCLMQYAFVM